MEYLKKPKELEEPFYKKLIARIKLVSIFIIAILALALLAVIYVNFRWRATDYTVEELKSMACEDARLLEGTEPGDEGFLAERAYNICLGYVENVAGIKDYKIYDFYKFDLIWYHIRYYMVIELPGYDNDKVTASIECDPTGFLVQENITYTLCSMRRMSELKQEFNDSFDDMAVFMFYDSLSESMHPTYKLRVDAGSDDYKKATENIYNRFSVYVYVSPETPKENADEIYNRIKPILDKYSAYDVTIIAPEKNDDYDELMNSGSLKYKHVFPLWEKRFIDR